MISKFDDIQEVYDDVERLIILRKRLGKKQWELAKDLGYTKEYIGKVENYVCKFTVDLKERINKYLIQEKKKDAKNLFSTF